MGAIPALTTAAAGAAALRGASGFLVFLLAFALRIGGEPKYWFGVLAVAAMAGGFLGDVIAPHLSRFFREEAAGFISFFAAGAGGVFGPGGVPPVLPGPVFALPRPGPPV